MVLQLKKLDATRIKIVTFSNKDYPETLKNIEDAPIVLYIKDNQKKTDTLLQLSVQEK